MSHLPEAGDSFPSEAPPEGAGPGKARRTATSPTPLLWVGGKSRALPTMTPMLQTHGWFSRPYVLVEAFTGSGALAFQQLRSGNPPEKVILCDAVEPLLGFYTILMDRPDDLKVALASFLSAPLDRERFEAIRAVLNNTSAPPVLRAAAFLVINWGGYNGLWRQNQGGGCNVPWGSWTLQQDLPTLIRQIDQSSADLHRAPVTPLIWDATDPGSTARMEDWIFRSILGDLDILIYADPPYPGTYSGYKRDWTEEDFMRLTETFCRWATFPRVSVGISFPASHQTWLPHGWDTHALQVPNMVGHTVASRNTREEVLVLSPRLGARREGKSLPGASRDLEGAL